MSKAKAEAMFNGLSSKQEENLNALYVCSEIILIAIESLDYPFHEDLEPEYKQMTDAVYAYSEKIKGLSIKQEENLNALYVCAEIILIAIESLGYPFHEDLEPEYKQMTDAVYAYSEKISARKCANSTP